MLIYIFRTCSECRKGYDKSLVRKCKKCNIFLELCPFLHGGYLFHSDWLTVPNLLKEMRNWFLAIYRVYQKNQTEINRQM